MIWKSTCNSELYHYASPYYDPVKAHEYYMRTRELKGRKPSVSLNEEGRAAQKQVREALTAERKAKVNSSAAARKEGITSSNKRMNQIIKDDADYIKREKERLKASNAKRMELANKELSQITELAKKKGLSQEEKQVIRNRINRLRLSNYKMREQLNQVYNKTSDAFGKNHALLSAQAKQTHKTTSERYSTRHKENVARAKQEYEQKYEAEMEKIRNESSFVKAKKKK